MRDSSVVCLRPRISAAPLDRGRAIRPASERAGCGPSALPRAVMPGVVLVSSQVGIDPGGRSAIKFAAWLLSCSLDFEMCPATRGKHAFDQPGDSRCTAGCPRLFDRAAAANARHGGLARRNDDSRVAASGLSIRKPLRRYRANRRR